MNYKGIRVLANQKEKTFEILLLLGFVIRVVATIAPMITGAATPFSAFLFESITLFIIAALISIKRNQLALFRIDRLTIVLLFIGILFRPGLRGEPTYAFLVFWCIGIWLIIILRKEWSGLGKLSLSWLFSGIVAGLVFRIPILMLMGVQIQITKDNLIMASLAAMSIHLSHSAIMEEFLFRGFLWGYLESRNWKNLWICLLQAALFWIAHLNYYDDPITIFVSLPVIGMIFGILVWKSRSIAPAMMAHTSYNSLSMLLS